MQNITIKDIKVITTAPSGIPLVVVKILTSEDGLYGLGCATYTWRYTSVVSYIEDYLKPLLIGQDISRIEDLWHTMNVNGYWRSGPVANNAISGIDMALWDLKGKVAQMPCYELWGGKSREYVSVYVHADGDSFEDIMEKANALYSQGFKHIRCQMGEYQGVGFKNADVAKTFNGKFYSPQEKILEIPRLFEFLRKNMGDEVEFIYDIHERLDPSDSLWVAKQLEQYRLFYLEDIVSTEDINHLRRVRKQTSTKIALGELFSNPTSIAQCITENLIDYLRIHPSFIGGITPSLKYISFASFYGIKTAWHGPADLNPIGAMANVQMSLFANNFGIQEWAKRSEHEYEVFPGLATAKEGKIYVDENRHGLGVDINEDLAKEFPCKIEETLWTQARLFDGTIRMP